MHQPRLRLAVALMAWLACTTVRAEEAPSAVLHLTNGGFVSGALRDSPQPGLLRWQGASFVKPFEFRTSEINNVQFPIPGESPQSSADWCFEVTGNDVIFGTLVELNEQDITLDVPRLGRMQLRRDHVHRFFRAKESTELIYQGPIGLNGWNEPTPKDGWREEAGHLVSDQPEASVQGGFIVPVRSIIELELSWKHQPKFRLAIGAREPNKPAETLYKIEVWDRSIAALWEQDEHADLAPVGETDAGAGKLHLRIYLDQEAGRFLVMTPTGARSADLKVPHAVAAENATLSLTNVQGDVRLESLIISRWTGTPPQEIRGDQPYFQRGDGTIGSGEITAYHAPSKEFVVRDTKGESRIAADQVTSVVLSKRTPVEPRPFRTLYQDRTTLSGELVKVSDGILSLSHPASREALKLPVAGLRSLMVLHRAPPDDPKPQPNATTSGRERTATKEKAATSSTKEERVATLELEGVRLPGGLVDGKGEAGTSCLTWEPQGSTTAAALRLGVSGRVTYRQPAPTPAPVARRQPAVVQRVFINNNPVVMQRIAPVTRFTLPEITQPAIHLRPGDIVPADVTAIDEKGVWFESRFADGKFVAHDQIKAVELATEGPNTTALSKSKRDRLLTLPRMQKENPPTQLLRTKSGDYLRGRIVKMDDKVIQVEVRLETKELPRDRISRIIWLHPEELATAAEPPKPVQDDPALPLRVQTVRKDGTRYTFRAESVEDSTLSGTSDVLGPRNVRLDEINLILFGNTIEEAASHLAYQQWKLQNAVEPKVAQSDSGGGGSPGTESMLVGKPAPDFELDLLDGKRFHLDENRGKLIVLDFWATWCGPCLQAMPQVKRVTDEFPEKDVKLIAVNLQEAPKAITAMMERHKFHMTVALDRDGVVAQKYSANAIPQTVVIKPDGTIARLFVGSSPQLGDQLREAIKAVLEAPAGK